MFTYKYDSFLISDLLYVFHLQFHTDVRALPFSQDPRSPKHVVHDVSRSPGSAHPMPPSPPISPHIPQRSTSATTHTVESPSPSSKQQISHSTPYAHTLRSSKIAPTPTVSASTLSTHPVATSSSYSSSNSVGYQPQSNSVPRAAAFAATATPAASSTSSLDALDARVAELRSQRDRLVARLSTLEEQLAEYDVGLDEVEHIVEFQSTLSGTPVDRPSVVFRIAEEYMQTQKRAADVRKEFMDAVRVQKRQKAMGPSSTPAIDSFRPQNLSLDSISSYSYDSTPRNDYHPSVSSAPPPPPQSLQQQQRGTPTTLPNWNAPPPMPNAPPAAFDSPQQQRIPLDKAASAPIDALFGIDEIVDCTQALDERRRNQISTPPQPSPIAQIREVDSSFDDENMMADEGNTNTRADTNSEGKQLTVRGDGTSIDDNDAEESKPVQYIDYEDAEKDYLEVDALMRTNEMWSQLWEDSERLNKDIFGHGSFRGKQGQTIAAALRSEDVFVLMPTGGKLSCFLMRA